MTTDTPSDAKRLAKIRRDAAGRLHYGWRLDDAEFLLRLLDARDARIAELEREVAAARNSAQSPLGVFGVHLPSCQLQRISSGGPSCCNCGLSAAPAAPEGTA